MTNSEIVQKAMELLTRRHVQLGVLETDEKDESLRGHCICGALLKAVDWKEPIGPLVSRLSRMARDFTEEGVGDLSEFSENYDTYEILKFMHEACLTLWAEELHAKA